MFILDQLTDIKIIFQCKTLNLTILKRLVNSNLNLSPCRQFLQYLKGKINVEVGLATIDIDAHIKKYAGRSSELRNFGELGLEMV